ncbi:hypothetical protein TcBrA4_0040540 [Trypanosoma cruzi]|nr:hypothetical protein TcBrA4_0040540 [Trypanosoma cruzi]
MEDVLTAELGPVSVAHRAALGELRRRLGICHTDLDCWLYAFLENKKFDVDETIAKLRRRAAMEVQELGAYEITALAAVAVLMGTLAAPMMEWPAASSKLSAATGAGVCACT